MDGGNLSLDHVAHWAGAERRFRLDYVRARELERLTGEGFGALYLRLSGGKFRILDLAYVIRLGLTGGGEVLNVDAERMVRERLDMGLLSDAWELAASIVLARMTGGDAPPRVSDMPMRLDVGAIMDLEEACGRVGIGEIYLRLATHTWSVLEIRETLRAGLLCAGHDKAAIEQEIRRRMDDEPLMWSLDSAQALLIATMSGIPQDETRAAGGKSEPLDVGVLLAAYARLGISARQVRETSWPDFVLSLRNAGEAKVQPPTEAEFNDLISRIPASMWTTEAETDGEHGDGPPPEDGSDPSAV